MIEGDFDVCYARTIVEFLKPVREENAGTIAEILNPVREKSGGSDNWGTIVMSVSVSSLKYYVHP